MDGGAVMVPKVKIKKHFFIDEKNLIFKLIKKSIFLLMMEFFLG